MKIRVRCPSCAGAMIVDAAAAGRQFACPACATPMVVPRAATVPAEPAPAPAREPAVVAAAPESADASEVVCPRCHLHFSAARHRETGAVDSDRKRILIVEDMGYFRKIAEEALSEEYDVETAGNVGDAQTVLARGDVDLIVLDLTLDADDDGLSLLRESMFKPCPVLIYTARDESEMYGEEWDELRRLGADDVLIKGIDVGESLQRKVGLLLGRIDAGDTD